MTSSLLPFAFSNCLEAVTLCFSRQTYSSIQFSFFSLNFLFFNLNLFTSFNNINLYFFISYFLSYFCCLKLICKLGLRFLLYKVKSNMISVNQYENNIKVFVFLNQTKTLTAVLISLSKRAF